MYFYITSSYLTGGVFSFKNELMKVKDEMQTILEENAYFKKTIKELKEKMDIILVKYRNENDGSSERSENTHFGQSVNYQKLKMKDK